MRAIMNRSADDTPAAAPATDVVELALRLVEVQSVSGEEGAVAALLAETLLGLDFDVELDDYGNVIGSLELGPGPTILFDAHLDTVPVSDIERWTRSPWGEVAGGKVFGRGAVDLKGPLAACVQGVAALRGQHELGRIVISGSVSEELAEGPALVRVAERVQPQAVVICEPSNGSLAIGQRGRAEVKVEIRGQSCHSAYPDAGRNAAEAMADVILALRDLPMPEHSSLGAGILVLTDLVSSPYPSLSVVPDHCVASFDRRTLPGESAEDLLEPIRALCADVSKDRGVRIEARIEAAALTTYTRAALNVTKFAPAWELAAEAPIVTEAAAGLGRAGLPAHLGHYAFCTNGSGSAGMLGIPTIGFGPGRADRAHTADEWIAVEDLLAGAQGYEALARALTAMTPEAIAASAPAALGATAG